MKINQNYIIGAAAVLGGGLYFAYKKGLFGKKEAVSPVAETKAESQETLNKITATQKAVSTANKITAVAKSAALISSAVLETEIKLISSLRNWPRWRCKPARLSWL